MGAGTSETEQLRAWMKTTFDAGIHELIDQSVFQDMLIEAKPAWVLPFALVIGIARNKGDDASRRWVICGDCPTSQADYAVAATPQQAARHFALAWQLKMENEEGQNEQLRQQSEGLYELSANDELWGTAKDPFSGGNFVPS